MVTSFKSLFSNSNQGVGVELTPDSVNIVQLKQQKQGTNLNTFAAIPIPEGAFQDGRITDPDAIADAIRQGITEHKIKAKTAISAVPIGEAVIRLIRLPAELDEMELRDMVLNQEAAIYLPFPREEADVDFQRLGTDIDEDGIERVEVLLVATPKDITENYLNVFQQAGLDLKVLEVSSFSLIRTLRSQLLQFMEGEAVALVNIDFDGTEISIVMDGIPQFNRKVPIGTHHLQNALSRAMNLPGAMGADLLQGMTVPLDVTDNTANNPSSAAILRMLSDLSDELRRSIDFYLNQGENLDITQVFVSGPGASLGQIDEFLTQRLGLTTTLVDPINTLGIQNSESIPAAQRPALSVVMGLGMREV
ncbi:type IV pilus assembly protein PilM [Acaryochloris sp. IP29b_bin.148]|uniref:type IV pilus assembly protein PilM n=1 Tax=Acaryochloris sp. IP29b_bin.148 TaxID=2969218 RepID=UPI00260E9559|nr:type IV pilus assembly protein PilM [Acaryochloris sp. IP29b_bin.148]